MAIITIQELLMSIHQNNFFWIVIPILFIGIVTDKYQEESGTSVGNAISNGALIIFTGFSWIQIISSRINFSIDVIASQYIFAVFIILYGFSIIGSGFGSGEFAKVYGRIRVITFMLIFFTMMIYVPLLYNYVSVVLFVLLFPFYYAFITELIKIMPVAGSKMVNKEYIDFSKSELKKLSLNQRFITIGKAKIYEYLE
ncbi:MAG: hypothetical protein PF569_07695 [Candidatus Woesearchaeota archaeon]|jgi:hypothetical protein|nr:hypothetical protein [Candidatus Woesearchaeota archaeon]